MKGGKKCHHMNTQCSMKIQHWRQVVMKNVTKFVTFLAGTEIFNSIKQDKSLHSLPWTRIQALEEYNKYRAPHF